MRRPEGFAFPLSFEEVFVSMTATTLLLQRGGREVTAEQLDKVTCPPPTDTWFPIPHRRVLDTTVETLGAAGFEVAETHLALSRNDARFFGTLDLRTPLAPGVTLAVGIRNSTDKSLPIAFCAGHRTLVCDNLAFSAEVVIARKHTRHGGARFGEAVCRAVQQLHQYREVEATRIRRFQETELSADQADALLLRAYEGEIVSTPLLPQVIREWREPSFAEFRPRTLWSLFNSFTTVLGERRRSNPQQFAALTIRLQQFLGADTAMAA
jgi:hypothetical protein